MNDNIRFILPFVMKSNCFLQLLLFSCRLFAQQDDFKDTPIKGERETETERDTCPEHLCSPKKSRSNRSKNLTSTTCGWEGISVGVSKSKKSGVWRGVAGYGRDLLTVKSQPIARCQLPAAFFLATKKVTKENYKKIL